MSTQKKSILTILVVLVLLVTGCSKDKRMAKDFAKVAVEAVQKEQKNDSLFLPTINWTTEIVNSYKNKTAETKPVNFKIISVEKGQITIGINEKQADAEYMSEEKFNQITQLLKERGPSIKGFCLGMTSDKALKLINKDYLEHIKAISKYPQNQYSKDGSVIKIPGLDIEFDSLDKAQSIIFDQALIEKLFNSKEMKFKTFVDNFAKGYSIPNFEEYAFTKEKVERDEYRKYTIIEEIKGYVYSELCWKLKIQETGGANVIINSPMLYTIGIGWEPPKTEKKHIESDHLVSAIILTKTSKDETSNFGN